MGATVDETLVVVTEVLEEPLLRVIFPYFDDTGESLLSLTENQSNTPD